MERVFIVRKNRDFTEGNGPMLFHSVWDSSETAIRFVENQEGIYGSKQSRDVTPDVGQNGLLEWRYNGYDVKEVLIRTKYEPSKVAEKKSEVASLEEHLRQAQKELKEMVG